MTIQVRERAAKSILTAQGSGSFLSHEPYPFTHTLSPYTGCQFGQTTCGRYCYAQFLPSWTFIGGQGAPPAWGSLVEVKRGAAALLRKALVKANRPALRIFMAPATDPYQPLEAEHSVTRSLLEVFAEFDDLGLLVVQTRGAQGARRDLDLMRQIPYLWLSVTVETDDADFLRRSGGGPAPESRLALVRDAGALGIAAQIAVSPCLSYTPAFAERIRAAQPRRVIVDSFVAGDGSGGVRTARSQWGKDVIREKWEDEAPARALFDQLAAAGLAVGWSAAGFCAIPSRVPSVRAAADGQQLPLI